MIKLKKGQALIIYGKQGSGKTLKAQDIAEQHGAYEQICFCDLMSPCGLEKALSNNPDTLIIEEVDKRSIKTHATKLKQLISSKLIVSARSGTEKKTPNFIFVTGDTNPFPDLHSERRFKVIETDRHA